MKTMTKGRLEMNQLYVRARQASSLDPLAVLLQNTCFGKRASRVVKTSYTPPMTSMANPRIMRSNVDGDVPANYQSQLVMESTRQTPIFNLHPLSVPKLNPTMMQLVPATRVTLGFQSSQKLA